MILVGPFQLRVFHDSMITFPGAGGTAKPHSSKLLPFVLRKIILYWLFQNRRKIWNTYSLESSLVTGKTTREGSQSWLNWLTCPWRVLSSPSITPQARQKVGGDAGNTLLYLLPFSSRKRKRDVVLQQWRPQVSSHTEPHTQQSLRAESEFQAIGSGTSAASE